MFRGEIDVMIGGSDDSIFSIKTRQKKKRRYYCRNNLFEFCEIFEREIKNFRIIKLLKSVCHPKPLSNPEKMQY